MWFRCSDWTCLAFILSIDLSLLREEAREVIKDFKASEKPTYHLIAKEVLASLAWTALYPFGVKKSEKSTPRRRTQKTVILVHGYLANRASFFPLSTYLKSIGVKQILSFNYGARLSVDQAAIALRDFIRKNVRGGEIDLVCHSLGGVIAHVYVQELGGHRKVNRCITLGTPFRGTYNAYWVSTRVGRDLRPDSPLMARIEATRSKAASVKFTSIVAGSDNIVIPRVFAALGEDVVHIPDLGHVGLLFSPTVFFEIAKRLHLPASN